MNVTPPNNLVCEFGPIENWPKGTNDYRWLLQEADKAPRGSVQFFARLEPKDCEPLAALLRVKPHADHRDEFRWNLQSLMVSLIEAICDTESQELPLALRRSVREVLVEFSRGNFGYVPDPVGGFPSERILDAVHGLINKAISELGHLPVPGQPKRSFLPADVAKKLTERGQLSEASYILNLIVAAVAADLARRYKLKAGRRKERTNRVIDNLSWQVVNLARKYSINWKLPPHKKGIAAGELTLKGFPPLDLATRLLTMVVDRAEACTRERLKIGKLGKMDARHVLDTVDALRHFSRLSLTKSLAAENNGFPAAEAAPDQATVLRWQKQAEDRLRAAGIRFPAGPTLETGK